MKAAEFLTYTIGFIAQLLFSWRMIDQWISSERSKKSQIPRRFWIHSLVASVLMFAYGWLRDDFAIVLGQILTYYIYIRNIQIQGQWIQIPIVLRWFLPVLPVIVLYYTFHNNVLDVDRFFKNDQIPLWLVTLGVCGQIIFTLRFVYQWLYSEKKKRSILPIGFWWCSLTGSMLIFLYAVNRKDPVLIIGQFAGSVVYLRNIMIIRKSSPI